MNVGLAARGSFLSLMLLLGACAAAASGEDEALGSDTEALRGDSVEGEGADDGAVAAKKKISIEGQYIECLNGCQTPDRLSSTYCPHLCNCIVIEGKDRRTCEDENPYIDILETPPPLPFPKFYQPGADRLGWPE
jgi:hypothetical protein